MKRLTLGSMQNPVRGFLHGAAAIASIVGVALLLAKAPGGVGRVMALLIFGASLFSMYVVSSLYHSFPWGDRWKVRMQRLDHAMIFFLVAGTFTPIGAIVLDGWWRIVTLSVVWAIAITGIALKLWLTRVRTALSVTLQMVMGWGALVPIVELGRRLDTAAIALTLAGGACYTAGMIMFASKRPRLFPRIFSYHEVFHVLVIAGSTLHFLMILWYVAPFTL